MKKFDDLDIIIPVCIGELNADAALLADSILSQYNAYGFTRFALFMPDKGWRASSILPVSTLKRRQSFSRRSAELSCGFAQAIREEADKLTPEISMGIMQPGSNDRDGKPSKVWHGSSPERIMRLLSVSTAPFIQESGSKRFLRSFCRRSMQKNTSKGSSVFTPERIPPPTPGSTPQTDVCGH